MVFVSPSWVPKLSVDSIPDSIPISQFVLDEEYGRCKLASSRPPFVCGISGRHYSAAELRQRVGSLSRALAREFSWAPGRGTPWDKVVTIYAHNTIDSLSVSWAVHALSGVSSPANAVYTVPELCLQIKASRSKAIFTCLPLLSNALSAAKECNIPQERVYLLSMPGDSSTTGLGSFKSVDMLVQWGATLPNVEPVKWEKGQGARQCAFLMFSSGTTGLPKGVMVSHKNVIANILQICAFDSPTRHPETRNVNLGLLPQSHIYGLVAICHASVYRGDSVVVLPKFDLQVLGRAIQQFRINVLYVVPPIVLSMTSRSQLLDGFDLSSVTEVYTGAAPLSVQLAWTLLLLHPGWKVRQAYGLTETATVVAATPVNDIRLGTCGSLLPGVEARLLSTEDGTEINEYNKPGELYVRSPSVTTLGYLDNPEASAETFGDNGWLRTGDVAMIVTTPREKGSPSEHLMIVDRIKELIKVKGHQVAPAELEDCLLKHPQVADVAVVPVPDASHGELPKAFVVLKSPPGPPVDGSHQETPSEGADGRSRDAMGIKDDIDGFVRKQKASYKWLRGGIEFVETIPKSPSGKILRRMLKDREAQKRAATSKL